MKYKRAALCGFILLNLSYFTGMILEQLQNFLPDNSAISRSAAGILNERLSQSHILELLKDYYGVIQMTVFFLCACAAVIITGAICKKGRSYRKIPAFIKEKWFCFIYLWIYMILFVSYDRLDSYYKNYEMEGISLSFLNQCIIFLMTFGAFVFLNYMKEFWDKYSLKEYFSGKNKVFFVIVYLYINFACCGQRLFLDSKEVVWTVNLVTLSIFFLFGLWILPFILMFLCLLEHMKISKGKVEKRDIRKKDALILWAIMFIIWGGCAVICYPAVLSEDSISAWEEIINGGVFVAEFPPLIKLCWEMLYNIIPTVAVVTFFQIGILSVTITFVLLYLVKKGMKMRTARIMATLFAALPCSYMYVITHWSNLYYTVAMLWVLLFILKMLDDEQYIKQMKVISIIGLSFSLMLVAMCRNEGMFTATLCALSVMGIAIKSKSWKPVLSIIITLCLVIGIRGWIYDGTISKKSETAYTSVGNYLLDDITLASYHFGRNIPKEDREILDNFIPLEKADLYYTDFQYEGAQIGGLRKPVSDRREVTRAQIHTMFHNLDVAFRVRLNRSECVWNVINAKGAHLNRCSRGIVENDLGLKANNTLLTIILTQILYFPTFMICISDVLLYRSGIYICAVMLLGLFWIKNGKAFKLFSLVPILAHALILVAILEWLCSRHTWCIILMSVIVIANEILDTTIKHNE